VWRRQAGVLTRRTPRSIVLATTTTAEPVLLTGIALLVWQCLADEQTTDAVIQHAADTSGMTGASVAEPVRDALRQLADLGAVTAE
jgi:hypothetical protein